MPRSPWATSSSSTCLKSARRSSKGQAFGSVESVKAVSDLYSPVSGKVTAVNDELTSAPESINTDAHKAWMIRIEMTDPEELVSLLSSADYENYVKEEGGD